MPRPKTQPATPGWPAELADDTAPTPERRRRRDDRRLGTERMEAEAERQRAVAKARKKARKRGDVKPPIVVVPADELIPGLDQRLDDLDALADRAAENIGMEPGLVALAVDQFDHEMAQFEAASVRLQSEVLERSRFMVFAAAAAAQGHHPIDAYCYIADRLDPQTVTS